jgi:cytochrome c oxidase subunit I+III
VFSRRKMFGYTALVLSMVATAFIGFGVWVHHMFVTPLPELGQGMFTASSLLIVIPNGIQIFCWAATLWGGRPWMRMPLVWVMGFFGIFIAGGLTGVFLASVSIDSQAHDTFFVVAHFHYVLIGGAVFPLFGAFYHWFPKWTGRLLDEKLGHLNFWLMFIGFNLTFYPMHHLGLGGMTRRVWTYAPDTGWGPLNLLASIGAAMMGLAVLAFIVNVLRSRRYGVLAGSNPWGGGTLEWAATSPPQRYNFMHPPAAQGREPLWENAPDAPIVVGLSTSKREVLCTTILDAAPEHRYDMTKDSLLPLALATGVGVMLIGGTIFDPKWTVAGLLMCGAALFPWFWLSAIRSAASKHPEIGHPHMD